MNNSKKTHRYISLIKQSLVLFTVYTTVIVTASFYMVQQLIYAINETRSAASRGLLDLPDTSDYPGTLGTFFNYYLNESLQMYVPIMIVLSVGLIILLFRKERNYVTVTGLSALPYTKKERFTINFLMGLCSLSIGFAFYFYQVIAQYHNSVEWIKFRNSFSTSFSLLNKQDSLSTVLISCLAAFLSICICYMILLLAMSSMGKLIISMFIGLLLIYTPLALVNILGLFIQNEKLLNTLKCFLCPPALFDQLVFTTPASNVNGEIIVSYTMYPYLKIGYGIILVGILTYSLYKVYSKNEVYRVNFLFMYPILEKHFVPLVTVSMGLCGAYISNTFLNSEPAFIITIALFACVIGFSGSSRLLAVDRK